MSVFRDEMWGDHFCTHNQMDTDHVAAQLELSVDLNYISASDAAAMLEECIERWARWDSENGIKA